MSIVYQPTYRISNTDHPYFNKRVNVLAINGKDHVILEPDDFCKVRLLGTGAIVWLWAFELRPVTEDMEPLDS